MVFQACRLLRKYGLLEQVQRSGSAGLTLDEIVARALRAALRREGPDGSRSRHWLVLPERRTFHAHASWAISSCAIAMTHANMDMAHDICYRGLFHLDEAIEQGRPAGLKTLGEWKTFYEGLSSLPPHVRAIAGWRSIITIRTRRFPLRCRWCLRTQPKRLLDVGGNTGKWAVQCAKHDPAGPHHHRGSAPATGARAREHPRSTAG